MKRTYIAFAVLAMTALVSCQQNEIRNDVYTPEAGEILFKIANNNKETKASDVVMSTLSEPIYLGSAGGHDFYLEETVTSMDFSSGPDTKSTPGYTENFHKLYGGFNAAAYQVGADEAYEEDGRFDLVSETDLIYKRKYPNDLWDASKGIYFFLRAGEQSGDLTGVSSLTYDASTGTTGGQIAFDYDASKLGTSDSDDEDDPASGPIYAASTQDILFTSRKVTTEEEYNLLISKDKGVPVLFHHVLTGVKFAIGNETKDDNVISINRVTLSNLYDKGHCVVAPVSEDNYRDNRTNLSSASTSVWSNRDYSSTTRMVYDSDEFGAPYTYSGGAFGSKGNYPSSFSQDGATRNLNDADATQTFWLVPQSLARTNAADHVILTVSVTDGENGEYDWEIDFTEALAGVEWKAGELRTYTIKIDYVNVMIEDDMDIDEKESESEDEFTSYEGSVKDNVVITNTGNTDVYIRASIIGQWLDKNGNPVFGFTDRTAGEVVEVASWYQDQFGTNAAHTHGLFDGLVGYVVNGSATGSEFWEKGTDGYYYYKYVVPADNGTIPGAYKTVNASGVATDVAAPSTASGGAGYTQPLFRSYTVGEAPDARVADQRQEIIFELEIATQAISAKKLDGSYYPTYQAAWAHAKNPDNQ